MKLLQSITIACALIGWTETVYGLLPINVARSQRSSFHSSTTALSVLQTDIESQPLQSTERPESKIANYAALASVPLLWGTYSPLIKKLYSYSSPPPTLIFNLLSFIVSFSVLSLINNKTSSDKSNDFESIKPGIELGIWLFMGSTLQLIGIQGSSASHAAILVQLTTIFVPILESILTKSRLSARMYIACILALFSAIFITAGNPLTLLMNNSVVFASIEPGNILVCASAVFYALHVVRLGSVAKYTSPVAISMYKSMTELILSIISIVFLCISGAGHEYVDYLSKFSFMSFSSFSFDEASLFLLAVILWNGVATTAFTTWAQTFGQSKVPPTQSNLIYSMQPVWATLFSFIFLHEHINSNTIIGSICLLGAIFTASRDSK